MRRVLTTAMVVLATFTLAAPATAGLSPFERKQQAQIRALQKQVKALTKRLVQVDNLAVGGILIGLCNSAATADALQGTWKVIDPTGTKFGAQQPVNDFDVGCKQLGVTRAQNQATVAVFQSILNIFRT